MEFLAERTSVSDIAKSKFGIDVHNEPSSKEQIDKFIESCANFLGKDVESLNRYEKKSQSNRYLNIEQLASDIKTLEQYCSWKR